jgi:hypothetical protein
MWYNERPLYNDATPGSQSGTGHFTQVVWKSTTIVGFGLASFTNSTGCYIYATGEYSPNGNYLNDFAANVLLCPALATTAAPGGMTPAPGGTTAAAGGMTPAPGGTTAMSNSNRASSSNSSPSNLKVTGNAFSFYILSVFSTLLVISIMNF